MSGCEKNPIMWPGSSEKAGLVTADVENDDCLSNARSRILH